mgnify:FL=1
MLPVLALSAWSQVAPEADASWDSAPSVTAFLFNLGTLSFFTFAASMTADWLGEGHLGALLDRVRPERLVGA